jgi:hypothetical protein
VYLRRHGEDAGRVAPGTAHGASRADEGTVRRSCGGTHLRIRTAEGGRTCRARGTDGCGRSSRTCRLRPAPFVPVRRSPSRSAADRPRASCLRGRPIRAPPAVPVLASPTCDWRARAPWRRARRSAPPGDTSERTGACNQLAEGLLFHQRHLRCYDTCTLFERPTMARARWARIPG